MTKHIQEKAVERKNVKNVTRRQYDSIHNWLRYYFGNATQCMSDTCNGKSKRFEWALKPDMIYEKKRENFYQLCRSCHAKQDLTEDGRGRMSERAKLRDNRKAVKAMNLANTGRKKSKEEIEKLVARCSIPIFQIKDGKVVRRFPSTVDVGKHGYTRNSVFRVVKGKASHHKGFQWKRDTSSALDTIEKQIK